jgi:hypothetical protein
MAHPGGPNSGGTNRDLGIPGDHQGGPGEIPLSVEERIFHETKFAFRCRYCEKRFIRKKLEQRFHEPRCAQSYLQGKIHDVTFERWNVGLHELQHWFEGGDDPIMRLDERPKDREYKPGVYVREEDYMLWDHARRRFYLAIKELKLRAERSRAIDAARAYKLLSDALLDLFAMPREFKLDSLNEWYFSDTSKLLGNDLGYDEQSPLPKCGMAGWEIISDTIEKRMLSEFPNYRWDRNQDKLWLDV